MIYFQKWYPGEDLNFQRISTIYRVSRNLRSTAQNGQKSVLEIKRRFHQFLLTSAKPD